VNLGGREITLKRTTPRNMALAGRISGTVSQALRWLGKEHVNDQTVAALQARLTEGDRQVLMADIRYVPAWVGEVFRAIAQPISGSDHGGIGGLVAGLSDTAHGGQSSVSDRRAVTPH
jgi:hypothetical protein